MAKIIQIKAEPLNIALKQSLKWGKGHQLAHLHHVQITVILDDGAEGQAEATPRPSIYGETQISVNHIIKHHLAPMLIGHTINTQADIDALETDLHHIKGNHTAKGALNMALYVALAKSKGQSLATLLGLQSDTTQVSYIVSTGKTDHVLANVGEIYGQGVRVFKMKIGVNIPTEIETIRQLIKSYPQAGFYVDANQCLDADTATGILNQLHDMGVLYCEEPLPIHQIRERQQLRQQTTMPIIADDSTFTLADVQRELALDTFDIVNIKTARTGFSQSKQIATLARNHGKQLMVGSQASSRLGCEHAALLAMSINSECATEASFYLNTADDASQLAIVDGQLSSVLFK